MTDYKNTLNLPKTEFPMKANLAEQEPKRLKHWEDNLNTFLLSCQELFFIFFNFYFKTFFLKSLKHQGKYFLSNFLSFVNTFF